MMRVRAWCGLCLVVGVMMSACTPAINDDDGVADTPGATATLIAEDILLEPGEPITTENAPRLVALGTLDRPTGRVSSIFHHDVSPDGTRLVALNNDLLIVWNLVTGDIIYTTSREGAIQAYYAPDQDEIYVIRGDGLVGVYASQQARLMTTWLGNQTFNGRLTYEPDAGLLAMGGEDGSVKVWDVAERISLATLQAHEGEILALAFDEAGERLATTGADRKARVWSWRERQLLHTFDHIDVDASQVTIAPDGGQVVTATSGYVAVWDTATDDLAYSLVIQRGGASDLLTYSDDGSMIASGGGVSDLLVWRAETGEIIATLPEVSGDRLSGRFGADDRLLLTSVLDRAVSLWDIANADQETVPRATLDIGTRRIVRADWTEDGFLMLFFDVDGVVYVWGIAD